MVGSCVRPIPNLSNNRFFKFWLTLQLRQTELAVFQLYYRVKKEDIYLHSDIALLTVLTPNIFDVLDTHFTDENGRLGANGNHEKS